MLLLVILEQIIYQDYFYTYAIIADISITEVSVFF